MCVTELSESLVPHFNSDITQIDRNAIAAQVSSLVLKQLDKHIETKRKFQEFQDSLDLEASSSNKKPKA
eukprot:733509-Rhodomonas_salina.1